MSIFKREHHSDPAAWKGKHPLRAALVVFMLVVVALPGFRARPASVSAAADADIGYKDMAYNSSGVSEPTAQKPQSKLWHNDGQWWGDFYSEGNGAYHIFALDWQTQVWSDTGVALDDRENSWADVLWDGTYLYVASGTSSGPGKLYRYTYDANPLDGKPYKLSPGFPVEVTSHGMEALVMAKDGTGKLWISYTNGSKVYVAHSDGSDSSWIAPYILPVPEASGLLGDDISSIVAYDGHVGVMWSNQNLMNMVFATHVNGTPDSQWQSISSYTSSADDHINLKSLHSDSAGNVFAVVKTSFSNVGEPSIIMLACIGGDCNLATSWEAHIVYTRPASSQRTRPILLLDTDNRDVYVFMATSSGGPIRYKKSSIDALNFPTDGEAIFIDYGSGLNDPTSTKQNLTRETGLVVAASDGSFYYHNCMTLTEVAECPDPNPAPKLEFTAASYTVAETGGTATVEVRRTGSTSESVSVDYAASNGTAESGIDYNSALGTLTFAAGETSQSFTIDIVDDGLDENDETVLLTLSNPTTLSSPGMAAELGPISTGTLTIFDDEEPSAQFSAASYEVDEGAGSITVEVVLNIPSILPIEVRYAIEDGTAVAGSDYETASDTVSFTPGETKKSFAVTILEDDEDEVEETVRLILKDSEDTLVDEATLAIVDNEPPPLVQFETAAFNVNEDKGEATVFVTLSRAPVEQVLVTYASTNNGTATSGTDYLPIDNETLSFAPGETRKHFTVTIVDNDASEPGETVELLLSNPQGAAMGSPDTAVITILDDEIVPTVQLTTSFLSLEEGAITVPIEVTLSAASAKPISVDYTIVGIMASPGDDFEAPSGFLTFIPGVTSQSILLKILDDSAMEANEIIQLSLSGPFHAELGAPVVLNINLVDDDSTHIYLPLVSGVNVP